MEQGFIDILKKLVAEQGKQAILDTSKCKAFLSDYTKGDYKKECRLLLQAIDIGAAQAIDTVALGDLAPCQQKLADRLNKEHFIAMDIAADIVGILALVLRGDVSNAANSKAIQLDPNYSQGTLTGKNGQGVSWTYTGGILNGLKHGKGKTAYAEPYNFVYEGNYVADLLCGKGKLTFADGHGYEGDFADGNRTGKGKETTQWGDVYEGDFVNGQRHGKGKLTRPDGAVIIADFDNGMMTDEYYYEKEPSYIERRTTR